MWDHYIGRQIRRANRNLLWTNGLLVVLVLGVAFFARAYLYNFFFGPFPLDHKTLLEIKDPGSLSRYFVHIPSDFVFPGLGQEIRQTVDKNTKVVKSETVVAEYVVALVRDEKDQDFRLLVVKTSGKISAEDLDGALIPMPQDVLSKVVNPEDNRPNGKVSGKFIRTVMLDTTGFRTAGYWGLGIGLPILLFGLWNVMRGLRRAANPERHPLVGALVPYGPPDEVARAIQEEIEKDCPNATLGQAVLTRSWLLKPSHFGLKILHLDDLLWVYKKVTKHSTNGVPTGTTYAAVLNQRNGRSLEIGGTEKAADEMLQRIYGNVPWILCGFDPQLAGLYQKKRDVVLDVVERRRQEFLKGQSTQTQAALPADPPAEAPAPEQPT
jgi:hypothetical protein